MKSLLPSSKLLLLLLPVITGTAVCFPASANTATAYSSPVNADMKDSEDASPTGNARSTGAQLFGGTISQVSESDFTVNLAQGDRTVDIATDQSTRFTIISVTSIDSLRIGDSLAVEGVVEQDAGSIAAYSIVKLDSDAASTAGVQAGDHSTLATVLSISPLTIQTSDGKSLAVKTPSNVQVLSQTTGSWSDLKAGSKVVVRALLSDSSSNTAATSVRAPLAQYVEVLPATMPHLTMAIEKFLLLRSVGDGREASDLPVDKLDYAALVPGIQVLRSQSVAYSSSAASTYSYDTTESAPVCSGTDADDADASGDDKGKAPERARAFANGVTQ